MKNNQGGVHSAALFHWATPITYVIGVRLKFLMQWAARQTVGQCVHGIVQWEASCREPERSLVHVFCQRDGEMRGLA